MEMFDESVLRGMRLEIQFHQQDMARILRETQKMLKREAMRRV